MEPSEGFMGSVISKFSRLLALEFSLPEDKDLALEVYGDLRRLRAYYCSAPFEFDASTGQVEGIRDLFYRVDNMVDSILVHTEHSETAANQEGFNQLLLKAGYPLDLLSLISLDADTLLRLILDYYIGTISSEFREKQIRLLYENLQDLVGIEKPRHVLINMLAQGDEMSEPKKQMKIVSIVGNRGFGKTTLAQVVYNQIKPQFECTAFVRAPLFGVTVRFLKEMIFQLGARNNMDVSVEELVEEIELINYIGSFLQNKRYLIVIDNLWDEDDWTSISRGLPNNDHGSRVITTTRMKHIAELCCSGCDELIYEIQSLGYLDSKKLFLKDPVSGEVSCFNTSLVEKGASIPGPEGL